MGARGVVYINPTNGTEPKLLEQYFGKITTTLRRYIFCTWI